MASIAEIVENIPTIREEITNGIRETFKRLFFIALPAFSSPLPALLAAYIAALFFEETFRGGVLRGTSKLVNLIDRRIPKTLKPVTGFVKKLTLWMLGEEAERSDRLEDYSKIFEDFINNDDKRREFEEVVMNLFKEGYTLDNFRKDMKEKFGVEFGENAIEVMDFFFQFKDLILTERISKIIEEIEERDKKKAEEIKRKIDELRNEMGKTFDRFEKSIADSVRREFEKVGISVKEVKEEIEKHTLEMAGFKIIYPSSLMVSDVKIDELKECWSNFKFEIKHVLWNVDAEREVCDEIVEEIKNGKSVLLLGESLSGKSALLRRVMIDVSRNFGVILYNEGYKSEFSPESLESALKGVSKDWKVLVVVDDLHNLPQMFKVVNETIDNGNITFLLAARQPNFDNIRSPFGMYKGKEEYEKAAREIEILLKRVKVFDEEKLRLSKGDVEKVILKYGEIFDGISVPENIIELLAEKFKLVGELACYLVSKGTEEESCVDHIFRRIEGQISSKKEVEDILRKVYIMSFLMKLAGVTIRKDAVLESAEVEEGDFKLISGTFLFPSDGFIETINEEFAVRYLEEFRKIYPRKFKESVRDLMERFKSFCSGEEDYYVAFAYGILGRIYYGRENLDLLLDVLDSLNFEWLDEKRSALLNLIVGTAYAIATDLGRSKAEDAKVHLERAVESGDAKAHNNLALLLRKNWEKLGMDEKEALNKAKELYEKASKLGITEAHFNLALLLRKNWKKLGMKKEDAFDEVEDNIAEAWKKREELPDRGELVLKFAINFFKLRAGESKVNDFVYNVAISHLLEDWGLFVDAYKILEFALEIYKNLKEKEKVEGIEKLLTICKKFGWSCDEFLS